MFKIGGDKIDLVTGGILFVVFVVIWFGWDYVKGRIKKDDKKEGKEGNN